MNTFGEQFRISIFGASHAPNLGVVIEGVPAGISLCEDDFSADLLRRKSGAKGTTPRIESDRPFFEGGIENGETTGEALKIVFYNNNVRDEDYAFDDQPRPGHADRTARVKYGPECDLLGGGQWSGRMTLGLVAAGVVAKKMLGAGVGFRSELISIGGCADKEKWPELLEKTMKERDSIGGVVECSVEHLPVGLGEPFFDSVESVLSHAVFSIPGVRGIEFGDGFAAAAMRGSEHNDPFGADGLPAKNGSGGVNGGITNGAPLLFRVAFKPTASIGKSQMTFNFKTGRMEELLIKGRHDACFALRTPVIVEAVAAIVCCDLSLRAR